MRLPPTHLVYLKDILKVKALAPLDMPLNLSTMEIYLLPFIPRDVFRGVGEGLKWAKGKPPPPPLHIKK